MSDFSRQKIKQIRILLGRSPTRLGEGTAESFLLRFVLFEALVKTVGRYYRESVGRVKSSQVANKESLQTSSVQRWLEHFSIVIHPERIKFILDSSLRNRGFKSARALRNGLVHQWDARDAEEAVARFLDLDGAMLVVIEAIEVRARATNSTLKGMSTP